VLLRQLLLRLQALARRAVAAAAHGSGGLSFKNCDWWHGAPQVYKFVGMMSQCVQEQASNAHHASLEFAAYFIFLSGRELV